VVLAIVMGVASPYFTKTIEPSLAALVEQVESRRPVAPAQPGNRAENR
jgi:hypothetical protein